MPGIRLMCASALLVQAVALSAQTFDTISIRKTRESAAGEGLIGLQPGRLLADETTVRQLIAVAYGLPQDRVLGGPQWIRSTRYAVTATTTGLAGRAEAQRMLQAMLADRFALKFHREMRPVDVYALSRLRPNGALGPKLRRSGPDCAPITMPAFDANNPPPPPPPPGAAAMRPLLERETKLRCNTMFFPGGLSARSMTIDEFVYRLSRFMPRPVVDRTGLTGEFDIDLVYQWEMALPAGAPGGGLGGGPPGPAATGGTAPALFTAVRDQLGLRLDATRAPAEVLVIDSVELPSEN